MDDHIESICECKPELSSECPNRFNEGTCDCECPAREFWEKKVACEMEIDHYWDSIACQCQRLFVNPRDDRQIGQIDISPEVNEDIPYTRAVDMIAWVLLGSSLTLVIVLALATGHYKRKLEVLKDDREEVIRYGFQNYLMSFYF